jgi:hypothetical protein
MGMQTNLETICLSDTFQIRESVPALEEHEVTHTVVKLYLYITQISAIIFCSILFLLLNTDFLSRFILLLIRLLVKRPTSDYQVYSLSAKQPSCSKFIIVFLSISERTF